MAKLVEEGFATGAIASKDVWGTPRRLPIVGGGFPAIWTGGAVAGGGCAVADAIIAGTTVGFAGGALRGCVPWSETTGVRAVVRPVTAGFGADDDGSPLSDVSLAWVNRRFVQLLGCCGSDSDQYPRL